MIKGVRPLFKRSPRWVVVLLLAMVIVLVGCTSQRKNWAGVAVSDDNEIFVAHDRFVAKLDAEGERAWVYPPRNERNVDFHANPTITEEVIYVGDYSGGVHAIDRETGEGLWAYKQSGTRLLGFLNFGGSSDRVIGSITVGDGILYVPDEVGIFILDQATGERLDDQWTFETDRAVWSQPLLIPATGEQPTRLIVTALDHYLYSLDPQSGETLWKTDLEGAAPAMPAYDAENELLFVGTFAGDLLAVNAITGEIIERYETDGWVWDTPALVGDILYFGDLEGVLYALQFQDNRFNELWRNRIAENEGQFRATPLVTEDLLIIGSDNKFMYAVNRDSGSVEWEQDVRYEVISALIAVQGAEDNLVVTATNESDELLVALRLDNGNERWVYQHKDND
jgi:outer membrane protein assembly factor BamB